MQAGRDKLAGSEPTEFQNSDGIKTSGFWASTNLISDPIASLIHQHGIEAENDAIVVLDANVLIRPYEAPSSIQSLEKIYAHLAKLKRLMVPGQAVREFITLRPRKLSEISDKLDAIASSSSSDPFTSRSRIFDENPDFTKALAVYSEAYSKFKAAQDEVKSLLKKVKQDHEAIPSGADKLSIMYANVLKDSIYDPVWDEEKRGQLVNDFIARSTSRIPPGFKDGGSNGDFLIWHTILEAASRNKRDCIFVTQETKTDWFIKHKSKLLNMRPELIAEYANVTGGKNIYAMNLSDLMKKFEAEADAVSEIERLEHESSQERAAANLRHAQILSQLSEIDAQISSYQQQIDGLIYMQDRRPIRPEFAAQMAEERQAGERVKEGMREAWSRAIEELQQLRAQISLRQAEAWGTLLTAERDYYERKVAYDRYFRDTEGWTGFGDSSGL